jgi:hypothetical protein
MGWQQKTNYGLRSHVELASTAQIGDVINPIDSEWEAML